MNAFSRGKWRHTPPCRGIWVVHTKKQRDGLGSPISDQIQPWMCLGFFLTTKWTDFLREREQIWGPCRGWVLGFFKEGLENADLEKRGPCPYFTAWVPRGFSPRALQWGGATSGEEAITWPPKRSADEKIGADPTGRVLGPPSPSSLVSHDSWEIKPSNWEQTQVWMWSVTQPNRLCQRRKISSRKTSHLPEGKKNCKKCPVKFAFL